jgi:Tfp pilus assembly protein PilO
MLGGFGLRAVAFAIVGALAPVGAYFVLFRPQRLAEVAIKAEKLDSLRQEVPVLEATVEHLAEFQREVALLEAKLASLDRIRPRPLELDRTRPVQPEPDPLVETLRRLSSQVGLVVLDLEVVPAAAHAETLPIRLHLRGRPSALVSFLERLPRLARIVRSERIEMRSGEGGFEFTLRLVTFRDRRR